MCGICGVYRRPDVGGTMRRMLDSLQHRGPDGEGEWSNGEITLGHRRLAIVDLSAAGAQPMVTADEAIAATTNGEIYNYPELRAELEAGGARFKSNCDSEVVLHAYRAWGTASFARFNGMFAFALWDNLQRRLFLVRDRMGIKPLYYAELEQGLVFASEIRALVAGTARRRWMISAHGLGQYLSFQNTLGAQTLFAGVSEVEPGHYLNAGPDGIASHCYWDQRFAENSETDFGRSVSRFRETFATAVRRHLMSDVPVASYLSAGFDSTLVTSLAARQLPNAPRAFTGRFADGGWYDEATGARLVASKAGVELTEVTIGPQDFRDHFDDMVFALDAPRMGIGALPQYLVAKAAAATHKLILTGHGGDELFSGYPVFKLALLAKALKSNPLIGLASLARTAPHELPHLAYFALQRMMRGDAAQVVPILFSEAHTRKALQPDVAEAVASARAFPELDRIAEESVDLYQRILLTYLRVYLPGLLVVEDKISMAHALESRTPFLDNEMVSLSLATAEEVKLHGGELKAIEKAAGRDILPAALFAMPKRGFPTPLRFWLRGPLSGWMRKRLTGTDSVLTRLFRDEYLKSAVNDYLGSWRRHVRPLDEIGTHRIWMLLCLESWLRQYQDRLGVRLEPEIRLAQSRT